jgi:hypothetical protein
VGAALLCGSALAQTATVAGDSPAIALAMATDLRPELTHQAVRTAMRKVADWQLERARPNFNLDWTFAALYDGLLVGQSYLELYRKRGGRACWTSRRMPCPRCPVRHSWPTR